MTELRHDQILQRHVLVAEHRQQRPNDFAKPGRAEAPSVDATMDCPFCEGHETATPAASLETFDADGRWRVRVVGNKYPVVDDIASGESADDGNRKLSSTQGAHEVIIETPQHLQRTSQLSRSQLTAVWDAYGQRLQHWREDGRFRYGLIFQNVGPEAGASLVHLHSQLIALPRVPPYVEQEIERLKERRRDTGACAYCLQIEDERRSAIRVVFESNKFLVFCPFASLSALEMWIVPKCHESSIEESTSASNTNGLANVVQEAFRRLDRVAPKTSYNLIVRTAPWRPDVRGYHWRVELRPRLAQLAGLELATGIHINHVAPERAAQRLRDA